MYYVSEIKKSSFEDKAFGCIIGAGIGDACGSLLEFFNRLITLEEVKNCMDMPGGGPHKVGKFIINLTYYTRNSMNNQFILFIIMT